MVLTLLCGVAICPLLGCWCQGGVGTYPIVSVTFLVGLCSAPFSAYCGAPFPPPKKSELHISAHVYAYF